VKCEKVIQLLDEYVEGNLADTVAQQLSEHIEKCGKCSAEEVFLRSMMEILCSLPDRSASQDFADAVMDKLSWLESNSASDESKIYITDPGSLQEDGLLSELISRSGVKPVWIGIKMMIRPVKYTKYMMPRPTVKIRTGDARVKSLTKLPVALGFRW
jgi:hypothetical protein